VTDELTVRAGAYNFLWLLKKLTLDLPRTCFQTYTLLRYGLRPYGLAQEVIGGKLALQRKWELIPLLGMVRQIRPDVVLEIGTCRGGTLRCWVEVASATAQLISLDLPGGGFGGGYGEEDIPRFRSWLKPGQSLVCLREDSHSPGTLAAAREALGGRPVDLLFIDGDHTYEGVRADFEMYSPLVRPGGLIVFHDIVVSPPHPDCRVYEFWREVKTRYRAIELVDRDGFDVWGGLGVLVQKT
jgi:cephalosporin hydroxylase